MEAMEEDSLRMLKQVLSDDELGRIPQDISQKLDVYFNEKFEEFVTAQAVFQTNRKNTDEKADILSKELKTQQTDLKDAQEKLDLAEKYSAELQSQLQDSKNEMQRLQNSIARLEKENSEFRRAKEAASDRIEAVQSQLDRRDSQVERLKMELESVTAQLKVAVSEKCQILSETEEIRSQKMNLDFQEKRLEKERTLMTQQMAGLEEELSRRTMELQTTRSETSSRALFTDAKLAQREEELRIANEELVHEKDARAVTQKRCDELAQKLEDQRNQELSMHSKYREEIAAQTRLTELYKGMADDSNQKAEECAKVVKELQDLVREASEQYGILETKHTELQAKYEEESVEKQNIIDELNTELKNANKFLEEMKQDRLDHAVEQLAPTAAAASKILKKGLSLTQIYTKLVQTEDELNLTREENQKLNAQMEVILKEIEDRAVFFQQKDEEYETALANIETLSSRLDELLAENNRLQERADEAKRLSTFHTRENKRLKSELSDLARQVCFLLKENQELRTDSVVPMNDSSASMDLSETADLAASQIISKKLVTFKDIEELQENNQKLISIVRSLSARQEEMEKTNDQIVTGELKAKLEGYVEQLAEMQAAQDRQAKMLEGLLKQRDMYKSMYQQSLNQSLGGGARDDPLEEDSDDMEVNQRLSNRSGTEDKGLQRKLEDAEVRLKEATKEFESYKQEKSIHEKMLSEEIDRVRKEYETTSTRCCRLKTQLDSSNEKFHLLQANVAAYKKQIKTLEEKSSNYSATIGKHEQIIMMLKDETLSAQSRLSRAEVQLENLRQERQILLDSETRLLKEREVFQRERHTQMTLKADVEAIRASLERAQAENQLRSEQRLDDTISECRALRRRLQEEQDRFRELSASQERKVAVSEERFTEQKALVERLQTDLEASRQAEQEAQNRIEELNVKLKQFTLPCFSKPGSEESLKRLKELETLLSNNEIEIKSLTEQLKSARSQSQQYCDISESAEVQLREMTSEYERAKNELERQLQASRDEIANLHTKIEVLNNQLLQQGQMPTDLELRENLAMAQKKLEELEEVRGELERMRADLQTASEAASAAEEKYANEIVQHSADLQALSKLKEETRTIFETTDRLKQERDSALEALELEKSAQRDRELALHQQIEECNRRIEDLDAQNSILHNQIQELSDQAAIFHSGARSGADRSASPDTSIECMNRSLTEEDSRSAEQLLKVMKYLRREKDLAVAKCDVMRAETTRLKSQVEIAEKRLEEARNVLSAEREKAEIDVVTTSKHAELLRKVETLNAITDSNRALREERDSLAARVQELTAKLGMLNEQVAPLREQTSDLESKLELLSTENQALKEDAQRWRQRTEELLEKSNKASPEDWRRLQTERENLSKLLVNEREVHAKYVEEFNALKTEKLLLEERSKQTSVQMQTLQEAVVKLQQQLEVEQAKQVDVQALQKDLAESKNKEVQIRKIAKKYKMQYEELIKADPEKAKVLSLEAPSADLDKERLELATKVEEMTLRIANLTQDLENMTKELGSVTKESTAKEERAKAVLKSARTKIMQLSDQKRQSEELIKELRAKVDTGSPDGDLSEHEARILALKSQLEGRISRLEHEKAELQSEKDALAQRVGQLQRQMGVGSAIATSEPPTANIKPMSARTETPLASIRPMSVVQSRTAAVLPTTASQAPVLVAPQQVHTTETSSPTSSHTDYQPASTSTGSGSSSSAAGSSAQGSSSTSSQSGPSANLRQLAVQPQLSDSSAESTQKEEEAMETMTIQQPQQQPQAVALVSPRVEQQQQQQQQQASSDQQQNSVASSSTQSVSTSQQSGHKRPRPSDSVTTEDMERGRQEQVSSPKTKRSRQQEVVPSATDIEYQVPTSSQRDQDEEVEEGCVVVDCDEGRGNQPGQEEEEFDNDPYEEIEEEEEELPYGVEVDNNEVEIIMEEDSTSAEGSSRQVQVGASAPTNQQQSEAISSAGPTGEPPSFASRSSRNVTPMSRQQQQQHLLLPQSYEDGGDDCIVPSTPTLFVPRRSDGFGEAVSSPQVPQGRFTFGDQSTAAGGSAGSSATHVTPPGRSMFGSSVAGLAQVVQEGMDDTRVDLTQLENDGSGRSVPTTPLQVSPQAELLSTITSAQVDEQDMPPIPDEPQIIVSDSVDDEALTVSQLSTDDQKDEQTESNTDSEMASQPEGSGSDSEKRLDEAGMIPEGAADDDASDVGLEASEETASDAADDETKDESREAEASPSSNTRKRSAAAAAQMNAAQSVTPPVRGTTARRSNRTAFRGPRGAAAAGRTPIVWEGSPRGGQTPRGHSTRGTPTEGIRGRGARGRRVRGAKFPYY